ncbi:LysR family transcriptional regulator [Methylosinus sp. H3A]|uniref:LysR substrate-binding domain-containing protein n=1 Tax=Methylosinus sp. H3A TaxID=2785786 RepID=UPI0018C1EA1D|nr:LysR substrate-binding domain-containing protein [Methylosinus sp. H3A]MBG0809978.1 LysR family transcriptional regulator [Methylosinus sp. H3A]
MLRTNLDMDVLRTLVVATELGGFVRAAARLGRTQSAISLQMKKLEEQVGQAIFRKNGRGVALTDTGDVLLGYAQRILALNDEAVAATRGVAVAGTVRLGLPQDLAEHWLSKILGPFHHTHPHIYFEAVVGRSRDLREQVVLGGVDMALTFGEIGPPHDDAEILAHLPLAWFGRQDFVADPERPLPLVLLDAPCMFRNFGIGALDAAGQPWRISFTSPSLAGLWGAIEAGLGVTMRTSLGMPKTVSILDERSNLPRLLGAAPLSLHLTPNGRGEAIERLQSVLLDSLPLFLPAGVEFGPALRRRSRPSVDAAKVPTSLVSE